MARFPFTAHPEREGDSHRVEPDRFHLEAKVQMLQMLVVTLREGIEAFLIVAIAIAYLRKTGREGLVPAAWWGTGIAVALSIVLGVFLAEFAVLPIWEAVLAAVAAVLVISMVVYMLKHAKKMRGEIGGRIESAAQTPPARPSIRGFLLEYAA